MSFLDNTGLARLWSKITTALAGKLDVTGNAYRSASIPWGQVDSSSTSKVYTATVPGITELRSGVCVMLMNGVVTSESGFTVNINNLGAKPVYSTLAAASRSTTLFNVAYTLLLIYNEERVSGGCWDAYYGYDSNTNTIGYQLRTNSTTMPTLDKFYRYRLLFTAADRQHLVPANTSSSTNATSSRTVNQRPIDPFGAIYYYGHTTAINANANPTASYFWTQYSFALGYSFNRTGSELTLTNHAPVYIKCAPQSDGSAIIDADTPYVQSLPTTNDGKIYIFLGVASSATAVELVPVHPVYYYNDGIKLWLGRQVYTKPSTGIPASDLAAGVIPDVSGKANSADLATVATSGSYNDLSDKPSIPDEPFVIPLEYSSSQEAWTTTATAAEIRANADNCVIEVSPNWYRVTLNAKSFDSTAQRLYLLFNGVEAHGVIIMMSFTIMVEFNDDVIILSNENRLGTYTKPTTGIPSSDLADGVIPSLSGYATEQWVGQQGYQTAAQVQTAISGKANSADLAAVATSGSYNDLSDKPTIPSAVTEQTVAGWGFTKNTGTYSKPSSGIPASDLAAGVIPEVPITSIQVNGTEAIPHNGTINIDIPTDYVTSVDFQERTNRTVVQLSYSNGVISFGAEGVPLNFALGLLANNCNIWFALSSEYLTNVYNEDDVVLFHLTHCKLNANAPSLTLTTYYAGNLYSATLVPSDAYHMAGTLNVIPLSLPSAESNSFGGGS